MTVPPCAVIPPVPPILPDTVKPVPVPSSSELALKVTGPDSVPAPDVLPSVPPLSVTALPTLAPSLMLSRFAPTAIVPLPASAPATVAALITSVPLLIVVVPV